MGSYGFGWVEGNVFSYYVRVIQCKGLGLSEVNAYIILWWNIHMKCFLESYEPETLQAWCWSPNVINGKSFMQIFALEGCKTKSSFFIAIYGKIVPSWNMIIGI